MGLPRGSLSLQDIGTRTNIVLDDALIERARQLTGLKALILWYEQAKVRQLRGKLRWEGDLHAQRLFRLEN
ncbi:MAG: type II toxin-antitoxin system VapB family antitoxin [Anaerolineae bacterium]|nr:type II toxin-antitoxin system VapB family antitoxin [Anaerolineae bacterium]MDW8072289.1 type II toxin-antitoxin system VapB family antitoxin [Anaerolineae bacterium]